MDVKTNGVDMSSFLLVEESADSEVDTLNCETCHHDVFMAGDEDDAESCSCDIRSEIQARLQEDFDYDRDEEDVSDVDFGDDEVNQRPLDWSGCKMWWSDLGYMSTEEEGEEEYSSWNGINMSRKVKDDMEDRLFWETCMAVGYP